MDRARIEHRSAAVEHDRVTGEVGTNTQLVSAAGMLTNRHFSMPRQIRYPIWMSQLRKLTAGNA
ncbi:MAG TPA: hypothetical protein VH023_07535 [Rhodopila sp.]|nr:hypothetical protein [Rhodopila sp.]